MTLLDTAYAKDIYESLPEKAETFVNTDVGGNFIKTISTMIDKAEKLINDFKLNGWKTDKLRGFKFEVQFPVFERIE